MNTTKKNTFFLENPSDLSYLTHVTPAAVELFIKELNARTPDKLKGKKLVAAIGTGGTISMKIENGIRIPDLDFKSIFFQAKNNLEERFEVISLDAFRIDSSQMDYSYIHDLAIILTYVWNNIKVPCLGFLIPHGTDTMAYSAATLSLVMGQGLPFSVAYTGAQKSIQEPASDAAGNLQNALYTLESLYDNNMAEVIIIMGSKAVLGTSAIKVNDMLANAFDAPIHKYVSNLSALEYPVRLAPWLKPKRKNINFTPTIWQKKYSQTLVIHSSLGLCPSMIERQIQDKNVQAILFFSYGAGAVDDSITQVISTQAHKRNLPTFVVSPVNAEYKIFYPSGKKLIEQGVIPLYMTLPSALAKIEIALGLHGKNTKEIATFMTENYVGEIPEENTRFLPILER